MFRDNLNVYNYRKSPNIGRNFFLVWLFCSHAWRLLNGSVLYSAIYGMSVQKSDVILLAGPIFICGKGKTFFSKKRLVPGLTLRLHHLKLGPKLKGPWNTIVAPLLYRAHSADNRIGRSHVNKMRLCVDTC